jgi:hypothetical protein
MNNYRLSFVIRTQMQTELHFNWQSHNVARVYARNNIHLIERSSAPRDYKLPGWQNCIISLSFFHLICAANEAEF